MSCFYSERVYDLKVFLKCVLFCFCFVVGVMTPPLQICLPSISLPPFLLIISLLSLYPRFSFIFFLFTHFSLRLLVRTCVHHQHILATCYLITRARVTLKTSLAEQTRVKHQSACYATKANHTTRLSSMVGRGTDTASNGGTSFHRNREKRTNQIQQGTFT